MTLPATTDVITPEQAAPLLDCSPETVVEHCKAGRLAGLKLGRSWVLPAAAFWQSLNTLALAEAEKRREGRQGRATPGSTLPTSPSNKKAPRGARTPPTLPALPAG